MRTKICLVFWNTKPRRPVFVALSLFATCRIMPLISKSALKISTKPAPNSQDILRTWCVFQDLDPVCSTSPEWYACSMETIYIPFLLQVPMYTRNLQQLAPKVCMRYNVGSESKGRHKRHIFPSHCMIVCRGSREDPV